jgi:hypothetical protein
MKTLLLLLLLAAGLVGCTTKGKARAEAGRAFAEGQAQAIQQMQSQQKDITVLGQVRNHVVTWEAGLTVAQAIDTAVYTGFMDPQVISLTRGGESVQIKIKDLLSGASNPPVEPGDVIEVRR